MIAALWATINGLANYGGDNAYAVRAIEAARTWIDERRGGPPPTVT